MAGAGAGGGARGRDACGEWPLPRSRDGTGGTRYRLSGGRGDGGRRERGRRTRPVVAGGGPTRA